MRDLARSLVEKILIVAPNINNIQRKHLKFRAHNGNAIAERSHERSNGKIKKPVRSVICGREFIELRKWLRESTWAKRYGYKKSCAY